MSRKPINSQVSRAPFIPVAGAPRPSWPGYLAIVAVALLVYFPALQGGFLWDDDAHVTKPALRSLDGLWRIWAEVGATQQYYPVLHSAFWFEHRLWGDAVLGYHLVNVLLHAACACLVVLVVRAVLAIADFRLPNPGDQSPIGNRYSAIPIAWLSGLLFALHPVAVESVAWITEQKNTLSTFFYLLAGLAYLRWSEGRKSEGESESESESGSGSEIGSESGGGAEGRHFHFPSHLVSYWIATALFVLALLTKSVTATLPAALLVVIWWRHGRIELRRDVLPLAPWLLAGVAMGLVTAWVERTIIGASGEAYALGAVERGLLAGRVVWFYAGKLLWPSDLVFIYPRWEVNAGMAWQYLFPFGAAAVLTVLWWRRWRGVLAAALIFIGTLFPVLGFFNVYPFLFSYVADHFQYLAMIPLLVLMAAGLIALQKRLAPKPGRWAVAAILALLGVRSWQEAHEYRDVEAFYRKTVADNPGAWIALHNLGGVLNDKGRPVEALECFEQALRLRPDYPEAEFNMGVVLTTLGRLPEAKAHYEKLLRMRPDQANALYNYGGLLIGEGRFAEAAVPLERAHKLEPSNVDILTNLGGVWLKIGRVADALRAYEEAVRIKPEDADFHLNFASALGAAGRADEARRESEIARALAAAAGKVPSAK